LFEAESAFEFFGKLIIDARQRDLSVALLLSKFLSFRRATRIPDPLDKMSLATYPLEIPRGM
jgi:hypothetical protein